MEADSLPSPFAPVDTFNEFSAALVPCIRNMLRACVQEELHGIRGDILSLVGAVQALKETLPSQKMQLGMSCGSQQDATALANGAPVPEAHKQEGELNMPHANPVSSRSAASNPSNSSRILKIVSSGGDVDNALSCPMGDRVSSGKKRSPSVRTLEAWRAKDLLCKVKPVTPARPPDLELQDIVPPNDAPDSKKLFTPRGKSKGVKTAETLRQMRETQLAATDSDYPLELSAYLVFGAWGIFPWECRHTSDSRSLTGACYRWVVLSVMLGLLACSVLQLVPEVPYGCPEFALLSDLPIVSGSLACLVALGAARNSADIASCFKILTSRSWNAGCLDCWVRDSRQELLVTLCIWACAVVSRGAFESTFMRPTGQTPEAWLVFSVLPFAVCSGGILAVACCALQICQALGGLIDAFCSKFIDGTGIEEAVQDWNELQAMIRQACVSIQGSFFLMLFIVTGAMLMAGADFVLIFDNGPRAASLIPSMILVAGMARVFFSAAEVTNKCGRVPALINSLDFGTRIDTDRQYIVDYITKSAAGFYVYETKITSVLVAKFLYLCIVMSAALTNELHKL